MADVLGRCGTWRHGAVENLPHPQRATCSNWTPLLSHSTVNQCGDPVVVRSVARCTLEKGHVGHCAGQSDG